MCDCIATGMSLIVITLIYDALLQSTEMSFISRTALNLANSTAWGISLELLNWLLWYRLAQASRYTPEINSRDK